VFHSPLFFKEFTMSALKTVEGISVNETTEIDFADLYEDDFDAANALSEVIACCCCCCC
jgi:hypothetical protein